MANLSPLDLIQAKNWTSATFTTYALSLSFVEAVLLDALIRGGGRDLLIVSDVDGVRAALSEQGARRTGRDYEVEPIKVARGVFHAKVGVLLDNEDAHLLVGSGNLTFNGWGGNFEVLEHLHPSFAADAFADAAGFFEALSQDGPRTSHDAGERLLTTAAALRRAAATGNLGGGELHVLHSVSSSISGQFVELAADLGGAQKLVAAAPYWDGGQAIDSLAAKLGLDEVFVHAHAGGTVEGTGVANWPRSTAAKVRAVRIVDFGEEKPRRMHAKAFEITCRRGRLLISGSANGSSAALSGPNNIEACTVRIQRERLIGWRLEASEAPEIIASPEPEETEEARIGVLRATLRGDEIAGRVLTPTLSGPARAIHVGPDGDRDLGEVELDALGAFNVFTPGLELQSLRGGRFTLRITAPSGQAEGFVSITAFSEVGRRAGVFAPKLMALLAGSEAPADVAAIMTWLHEDPSRLRSATASAMGGGSTTRKEEADVLVPVSELHPAFAARRPLLDATSESAPQSGWSRFMAQIFAALREPRGPFSQANSQGDGIDDEGEVVTGDVESERPPDPDAVRALANFEKLFDLLLQPHNAARFATDAFDLANYVCDRLEPDESLAQSWLDHLMDVLLEHPPEAVRLDDVASAIVLLCARNPSSEQVLRARGRLLRLGFRLVGPAPDAALSGFERVIPHAVTREEAWQTILAASTSLELVHVYVEALKRGTRSGDFEGLKQAAPEEWPILQGAFASARDRKQILTTRRATVACPKCHSALPAYEAHRMRSMGIGRASNCCGRIILCEGV